MFQHTFQVFIVRNFPLEKQIFIDFRFHAVTTIGCWRAHQRGVRCKSRNSPSCDRHPAGSALRAVELHRADGAGHRDPEPPRKLVGCNSPRRTSPNQIQTPPGQLLQLLPRRTTIAFCSNFHNFTGTSAP
uniref:(northern house mosquito) hypothetical protein n=1 Tax=Culex pipiens TaxID=7175 RepID=A0A8D8AZU8_CULPI